MGSLRYPALAAYALRERHTRPFPHRGSDLMIVLTVRCWFNLNQTRGQTGPVAQIVRDSLCDSGVFVAGHEQTLPPTYGTTTGPPTMPP